MQLPVTGNLREAILLSLSYLDAVGIAPTAYDVWRCLPPTGHRADGRASLGEVYRVLRTDPLLKTVLHRDRGHLSLQSPEHIDDRLSRGKISERKWRRARTTASFLTLVPFVTSVSVANTVATGTARATSDVDLFITIKPGRMWTARLLVTAVTFVLGRFRYRTRVADRMCLSFYVTDDALDLSRMALSGDDPYLAHWIGSLGTLWEWRSTDTVASDAAPLGQRLFTANPWVARLMPNLTPQTVSDRRCVPRALDRLTHPLRRTVERLLSGRRGDRLEQYVRAKQLRRMNKVAPTELRTTSQHIVVSDSMLKFHEQDRRVWFRQKTVATYRRLLIGQQPELSDEQPELSSAGLVLQPVGATVS